MGHFVGFHPGWGNSSDQWVPPKRLGNTMTGSALCLNTSSEQFPAVTEIEISNGYDTGLFASL